MVINGRKNMMNSKELSSLLAQCIGTENYYRLNPFHLIYTDGVKVFAENAEAYWFLNDLAVYLKLPELSGEYFLQIKLNVDEKNPFSITLTYITRSESASISLAS